MQYVKYILTKQHCKNPFTEWQYFPMDLCGRTTCKPRSDNQLRLNKSNFDVSKQTPSRLCCEEKHAWFIIKSIQYDTHQTLFTIHGRKKQSGQDLTDSRTSVIEYSDNNSPLLVQPPSILQTLKVGFLWFVTRCKRRCQYVVDVTFQLQRDLGAVSLTYVSILREGLTPILAQL